MAMTAAENHLNTTPAELVAERLRASGKMVKGSGPSWTAQCPAHDDRSPSLSLTESPTGKALLNCHAGCTVPDICRALDIRMADLFPDRPEQARGTGLTERATYSYTDEAGEILFQVVRFIDADGRKTFRQRRPVPSGWSWGLADTRRVPYMLPQLLKAVREGREVWVTEGEKDAENLQWHVDGAVTCNPMGAGAWREEYNEHFRGAVVRIVADDDVAGRGHADEVAIHLAGIAKSVEVVLPAEGFNDISDHLKAGHPLTALRPIVGAPPAPTRLTRIDWSTFWTREPRIEEWGAWPLLPVGRAVSLFAPAKAGKSTIILSIVAAAVTGGRIFGQPNPSQPRRTLYLDFEMTEDDLHERLVEMGYGPQFDLSLLDYVPLPSLPPLDTAAGAKELFEAVGDFGSEQVIIDTFGRATEGEENSNDTVRAFYRHTGLPLKEKGIGYVRTDHAGKEMERGQRGASGKNDDVDLVWSLERTEKGAVLKRTHARIGWGPSAVPLERNESDEGVVTWRMADTSWPKGTAECAQRMAELGLPLDISRDKARAAGVKGKNDIIGAALRWRLAEATAAFGTAGTGSGTGTYPQGGTASGTGSLDDF
jgi:hypothetical protein